MSWEWGKTQEGSTEAEIPTAAEIEAESVSLDRQTLFLVADETKTLTATVYPEDASDKTVNWVSSNPETASVDENGVVTGISEGETAVFAITADGGKTAKCAVTVEPSISGHGYADLGLSVKWATPQSRFGLMGTDARGTFATSDRWLANLYGITTPPNAPYAWE